MTNLTDVQIEKARRLYLSLAALFVALIVACNLIFQKFVIWNPFGWYEFKISVGVLAYPVTFLCTDIISEIFGRKRANDVVKAGLLASVFVTLLVLIADLIPAMQGSPLTDDEFSKVFGLTGAAVSASMIAYLFAQFVDIRLFHYWKELTKGDHLWLRNNFSTIFSQLVDTSTVITLLCAFGALEWSSFWPIFISGFLFKVVMAALDTPLFYLAAIGIKKHFGLGKNDEIRI